MQTLAFMKHTVMLKALENWPVKVLGSSQESSNALVHLRATATLTWNLMCRRWHSRTTR